MGEGGATRSEESLKVKWAEAARSNGRVFPPTASARVSVRIAPTFAHALSRGLGSSLCFAPAFAPGETPFRMTVGFGRGGALRALLHPHAVILNAIPGGRRWAGME